ncbi:MAG TPA: ABC transporter substrate-binding protein [Azospirillum sp.]|nr:ABC transporter substrate-binding protein [Azospirillum sp.]
MAKRTLAFLAAAAGLLAGPAGAEELRIGFMSTLTGPQAVTGQHLRDGFMLGVEHAGGKLGGMDTKVVVVDDQLKPDVAVQEVEGLLKRDNVHIVAGVVYSNILMAVYKPVVESDAFLISANAGPAPVAGNRCSENFFNTSWQNDQTHGAVGKYVSDSGVKKVFLLAPNYQAGKDGLTGFKRHFKGEVVDEVYTKLGQLDFSAEIARIQSAKPDAVYTFMPGGMGVNLVKQYAQAGLKEKIPLFSAFTVDETTLPATEDAGLGLYSASIWAPDMDNPASRKFVEDFRKKYGYVPAYYAAQAYDAARLIDAAVKQAGGVSDKAKLRDALRKAKFDSVRGSFKFNTNHFPVSDFYLVQAAKLPDGAPAMLKRQAVFDGYADDYAKECPMKW